MLVEFLLQLQGVVDLLGDPVDRVLVLRYVNFVSSDQRSCLFVRLLQSSLALAVVIHDQTQARVRLIELLEFFV